MKRRWWVVALQVFFGPFFVFGVLVTLADPEAMKETSAGTLGVMLVIGLVVTGWMIYGIVKSARPKPPAPPMPPQSMPVAPPITRQTSNVAPFPSRQVMQPSVNSPVRGQHPSSRRFAPVDPHGGHMKGDQWIPPKPYLPTWEAWGNGANSIEVAGVHYRRHGAKSVVDAHGGWQGSSLYLKDSAVLVRDPNNPFSKGGNATAVYIRGNHVGYIPETASGTWRRALDGLGAGGRHLEVNATVNCWLNYKGQLDYSIALYMPDQEKLSPVNELPEMDYALIPAGKLRQVTRENEHMDVLKNYVQPGAEVPVAVVLRKITEVRARSTVDVIQVELDGSRIGQLTPQQSNNLMSLIEYIEARGKLPVARGEITGNNIQAEVTVRVPTASEIEQNWLDRLGPELAKPAEVIPGPDWDWDED